MVEHLEEQDAQDVEIGRLRRRLAEAAEILSNPFVQWAEPTRIQATGQSNRMCPFCKAGPDTGRLEADLNAPPILHPDGTFCGHAVKHTPGHYPDCPIRRVLDLLGDQR